MKMKDIFGLDSEDREFNPHPLINGLGLAGIEIELENVNIYNTLNFKYWSVVGDGSLRNSGAEFVCSRPWAGKTLYDAIMEIDQYLFKARPDATWRCSTHVHIDVRDFTENEIKKLILAYAVYETVLYRYSGFHRIKNNFCPALSLLQDKINLLSDYWNRSDFIHGVVPQWNKYTSINLLPIQAYGSVEFRIGEAKCNRGQILRLVNRFLSLRELAKRYANMSDIDFVEKLQTLDISKVFDKGLPRERYHDDKDIQSGVEIAYDILNLYKL